jgi:hypothetical protein
MLIDIRNREDIQITLIKSAQSDFLRKRPTKEVIVTPEMTPAAKMPVFLMKEVSYASLMTLSLASSFFCNLHIVLVSASLLGLKVSVLLLRLSMKRVPTSKYLVVNWLSASSLVKRRG